MEAECPFVTCVSIYQITLCPYPQDEFVSEVTALVISPVCQYVQPLAYLATDNIITTKY